MESTPSPSWWKVALVWLLARVIVFAAWAGFGLTTQNDVLYYWHRLHLMWTGVNTPADTLVEYPTPVIWLLSIPYGVARLLVGGAADYSSRPVFVGAFIGCMLLLDLLFAVALWRAGGDQRRFAVLFWVLFTFVMGPTTYMRFDLIPAVLGGLAGLALLARDRGRAGAYIGVGAAIKLWPALLWPATLGGSRRAQRTASVAFWGVGGGLAVASLLHAGWHRLLSPLTWQSGRGLQIESVAATPAMLLRGFAPEQYRVAVSRWQAFEIAGPGTSTLLSLATLATALGIAALAGAYVLWLRRPDRTVTDALLLMVLVIVVTIVTNKTFSPQYMMWLGGPLAALLAASGQPGAAQSTPSRRQVRHLAYWVLGLTLGTQLVYPILYEPLVHGGSLLIPATLVLVARNVAMVWFTAWLVRLVWRTLHRTGSSRADRRRGVRKVAR